MPFFVTVCEGKNALAAQRLTERGCTSNEQTTVLKLPPDLAVLVFIRYSLISSRFIKNWCLKFDRFAQTPNACIETTYRSFHC